MLVTLSRRLAGGGTRVAISAPGVAGSGLWGGDGDPIVGVPIHVELEVPGPISWDRIAIATSHPDAAVPAEDELMLSGVVEHRDDDGVIALRVADSIVLVETVGEPPRGIDGGRVSLVARGVEVYPTGV